MKWHYRQLNMKLVKFNIIKLFKNGNDVWLKVHVTSNLQIKYFKLKLHKFESLYAKSGLVYKLLKINTKSKHFSSTRLILYLRVLYAKTES